MDLDFEVVSLPESDHPEAGETAPDFTRPLVNEEYWEDASLSSVVAEGPTLLVFHPMDGAFPTTYIWNEIDERGFVDDVRVVGVSVSTPYEHKALLDDRAAGVRLFSDPAADVAAAYGVENDLDGMAGVTEHRPATFLLDESRTVQYAWVAQEWPAFPDYDAVEAAIDDLD
ncbi:redoxin domain-containing protein [Halobellus litoreus]|uniref:Redoxin domain-containing protein n=1 Tax=Halobellus litoreus TaxID=755310 RepID=A0ABD6DX81_9EURY|nr:redoxin domain-containing protein [Halobellus litoreus]